MQFKKKQFLKPYLLLKSSTSSLSLSILITSKDLEACNKRLNVEIDRPIKSKSEEPITVLVDG